nr:VOC family protein [Sphingobium fontiphilum]
MWFDGQAEEAARFYVDLFGGSIDAVSHYGDGMAAPAGTAMLVAFTLRGRPFQALNGGPQFPFTEAISLSVACADQAEVDRLFDALTADGGTPSRCGWVKDRYGLSWQLVPQSVIAMHASGDSAAIGRMMAAMMPMGKLDVAKLEAAFGGEAI